ncbi:conjugal transfer protein TraF [Vibrio parahaemolyticus]|uniref:conjugal transfer protein TraF n=1 Tax=Vibrio parahaemolyticus TaxID=670 RepID=UPI0011103D95|nr:conjugal transfer protein TraF [Vibrio parahaemolyticus]MEA5230151.1 conjugal transfer protein TraF [Vibrio parahaemolyticus]TMX39450.1 conjugal transfer protein TraF [Vibrio parahaemolyticus]TMX80484.1 conjugal transfer protein TraF [Vibrio parahaemolyticus]
MKTHLSNSLPLAFLLASTSIHATNYSVDARSMGMGGTGVTTSDALTGPFINPAMIAVNASHKRFGLMLPALGVTASDSDRTLDVVDEIKAKYEHLVNTPSYKTLFELDELLDDLSDNQAVNVNSTVGVSAVIPNDRIATSIFGSVQLDLISSAEIATGSNPLDRYNHSTMVLAGSGILDVGVSFARELKLKGHSVTIGISPKYQELRTYSISKELGDFDLDNYEDSEKKDARFNVDVGATWMLGNKWRFGVAAKNLIPYSIDTIDRIFTYSISPEVTLGAAYIRDSYSVALDADVTKLERFNIESDDTQMIRAGVEFDAWSIAQIRFGYESDLKSNLDDSISAGIGLNVFDKGLFDVAAQYAGENQAGVSANMTYKF